MENKDKDLQSVFKNVKSLFYKNKSTRRPPSRKVLRQRKRIEKRAKQHDCRYNKSAKEGTHVQLLNGHKKRKKRKQVNLEADQKSENLPTKKRKGEHSNPETNEENGDNTVSSERQAYEIANKQDAKLISSLGKKLKVGKSMPKHFCDDGLDYLLEVCGPLGDDAGADTSDDEFLAMKGAPKQQPRKKQVKRNHAKRENPPKEAPSSASEDIELSDDDVGSEGLSVSDESNDEENHTKSKQSSRREEMPPDGTDDDVEGNSSVEDDDPPCPGDSDVADFSVKEEANHASASSRYIPPALRKIQNKGLDKEKLELDKLKKLLKGLVNRLSSTTLVGIVSEIEGLYNKHSRNVMNENLYELVLEACCVPSRLPDRLLAEHMVLVAALHALVGTEVGSYFLQKIVEKFHALHWKDKPNVGKECDNLLYMLVCLYQLKVVDCLLVYDIVRRLVQSFQEADIDMVLQVLKACGPQIRKDDPGALKECILEIQAKAASSSTLNDNSRVRFMLETIGALKNNNMRKIPNYDPSILEEAKKLFKSLISGKESSNSGVQLKISLEDLLHANEKGRWWIVGSAWSGSGPSNQSTSSVKVPDSVETKFSAKLLQVAKQQRMNTELRKTIFCTLMTSEDFVDAFEKLLKLSLKEKQSREVIHVLVDCCLHERSYNPFYAHLADKLCQYSRSNQVTFQYTLWDRFKTLSTNESYSLDNLAQLMAHLFAAKSLSISVLKTVSFGALESAAVPLFIRLFSILLFQYPKNVSRPVFLRISTLPKLALLREGIKVFLRRFLQPSQLKVGGTSRAMQPEYVEEMIEMTEAALDGREYVKL